MCSRDRCAVAQRRPVRLSALFDRSLQRLAVNVQFHRRSVRVGVVQIRPRSSAPGRRRGLSSRPVAPAHPPPAPPARTAAGRRAPVDTQVGPARHRSHHGTAAPPERPPASTQLVRSSPMSARGSPIRHQLDRADPRRAPRRRAVARGRRPPGRGVVSELTRAARRAWWSVGPRSASDGPGRLPGRRRRRRGSSVNCARPAARPPTATTGLCGSISRGPRWVTAARTLCKSVGGDRGPRTSSRCCRLGSARYAPACSASARADHRGSSSGVLVVQTPSRSPSVTAPAIRAGRSSMRCVEPEHRRRPGCGADSAGGDAEAVRSPVAQRPLDRRCRIRITAPESTSKRCVPYATRLKSVSLG